MPMPEAVDIAMREYRRRRSDVISRDAEFDAGDFMLLHQRAFAASK